MADRVVHDTDRCILQVLCVTVTTGVAGKRYV